MFNFNKKKTATIHVRYGFLSSAFGGMKVETPMSRDLSSVVNSQRSALEATMRKSRSLMTEISPLHAMQVTHFNIHIEYYGNRFFAYKMRYMITPVIPE